MTPADLRQLHELAEEATGRGLRKWHANARLLTWFRSDPVAVVRVLQAAAEVHARPGGLSHSRLYSALEDLPAIPQEDESL